MSRAITKYNTLYLSVREVSGRYDDDFYLTNQQVERDYVSSLFFCLSVTNLNQKINCQVPWVIDPGLLCFWDILSMSGSHVQVCLVTSCFTLVTLHGELCIQLCFLLPHQCILITCPLRLVSLSSSLHAYLFPVFPPALCSVSPHTVWSIYRRLYYF